jgi:LacI family transcriptional regulator
MARGTATLADVARLAGVSKSTASRILAAKEGRRVPYSPATQEGVRNAAILLNYTPSKLARGLTGARTGIVGLVIPTLEDSFFTAATTIIEGRLGGKGYNVILSNTSGDSVIERAKVEDLLAWPVDGLVIAPVQQTSDAGLFWELWQRRIPFVLIDRVFADTPFYSVTTDDHAGAVMAVEHLLSLGRGRIARVGGPGGVSTNRTRQAGYADALMRNGILPEERLAVEVPPTEAGGRRAMEHLMRLDEPPDAVFCFSDLMAIGVMEVCLERGIRIPEEIELVGYADLDYSGVLRIPLTSVRQPRNEIGLAAAEVLLARLDGQKPETTELKLPVELVVRESTCGRSPK